MGTFRYLMAVSAATGITLSTIGVSNAVELPSATQPQNAPLNNEQSQTPTEPTQATSPAASKLKKASDSPTEMLRERASTKDNTGVAQATPSPSVTPQPLENVPKTPVPDNLIPHPNPLLFPTKPQEVQLQRQERITLQQALELARRNSPQIQVGILTVERSRASLREALAAQFPTLNLSTDFTSTNSASGELSNEAFKTNQSTVRTTFTSDLDLSYNVYTSGLRSANIRAAEQQVRFDELDVERLVEQLRFDVTSAYYDLQQADEQVLISEAAVRNATRSLSDAEALERAGLGTRFDVLRARVQLANANQDLVQNRSQQLIARRQLVQLLNLPQTVDIASADPIVEAGSWNLSLEDSIVLAYKNRAELEQQLARRNISEQQRRAALAANRPQISVFANYNLLDVFDDQLGLADGYSLGARLRLNFFDGGAARARARQQEANKAIAETQFTNTRNQIRFEIEQAYSNLQANAENIQTTTIAVQEAEESLRLANLRFRAGVGTQTDVINAETELTTARVNRLRAIIGYNRALASLQRGVSNFPNGNLSDTP